MSIMSLLYSSNFKLSNDDMKKYPDYMDFDSTNNHNSQLQHHGSGGLMRYYSAPNSLFSIDGTEGFHSRPEAEAEVDLSRFMAMCNGKFDSGCGERAVKQETVELVHQPNGFVNQSGVQIGNSFGVMNFTDFNSSPSGGFSHTTAENGNMTRDAEKFRTCNRKDVEVAYPSTQIGNRLIMSGQSFGSSHMPPIAKEKNKSIGGISSSRPDLHKTSSDDRLHTCDFLDSSWDNSAIRDFKRGRDNNGCRFSTSTVLEAQNADSGNNTRGLAHHLSLPISFNKDPLEKFLRFQDPVPHQIRAKRGCATHPRSIAERVRRTRISERMKKLQELFPDMDKTNTADMLELAVEYIKGLQRRVKTLTDTKAKCTCSCSSQK